MRKIKFRAWSKHDKQMMYRGVYDINWYATEYNDENGCHCLRPIKSDDRHSLELMQYTGLKDKNGKEIYEKDIINDTKFDEKAEILFKDGGFGFKLIPEKEHYDFIAFSGHSYLKQILETFEIIGNIHENPELYE